ncbi:MAG TPA: hypothetical protein VEZ90_18330 [Blastocatellia bacterium]|nr:hypothetical protein [Blastocatellia bacterium]
MARFCRRCGAQVGPGAASSSPSEATTWTLEQSPQPSIGTQPVLTPNTAPAYLSPQTFPPVPLDTNGLAPKRNTASVILFSLLLVVLLAVGAGFLTFEMARKGSQSSVEVPPPPSKQVGDGTVVPQAPAVPPAPPAPPTIPGDTKSSGTSTTGELTLESLRYPGSQSTFNISGGGHGAMILSSQDPADKVAKWYSDRLQVKDSVVETGSTTILSGRGYRVVISSSGSETNIVVAHGSNSF